jgi:hypothetical protein
VGYNDPRLRRKIRVQGRGTHLSAALERHRHACEAYLAANDWINRVWAAAGGPAPEQPHLAAEMDQARAAQRDAHDATFHGPISTWWDFRTDASTYARLSPYAVLFLEWEAGTWLSSPWTAKELTLKKFARRGVPEVARQPITDLVVAALTREYRCKDWLYAPLARAVDGPALRDRLVDLRGAPDPLVRLRAEFVGYVLDRPNLNVTDRTWRRWLAES